MTKTEFWIMECALEHCVLIGNLSEPPYESVEAIIRPRGVDVEETIITLDRMFLQGDLTARTGRPGLGWDELTDVPNPSRGEIAQSLIEPPRRLRYHYQLTEQGARRWESVARPRWNEFLVISEGREEDNDPWIVTIEAMEAKVVEGLVAQSRSEGGLIEGIVEMHPLVPWNATYWKTLPIGYRAHYRLKSGDTRWPTEWYSNPFEHTESR
jgi:hypothetical protein